MDDMASLADQDPVIVAGASCQVAAGDSRDVMSSPEATEHCSKACMTSSPCSSGRLTLSAF